MDRWFHVPTDTQPWEYILVFFGIPIAIIALFVAGFALIMVGYGVLFFFHRGIPAILGSVVTRRPKQKRSY